MKRRSYSNRLTLNILYLIQDFFAYSDIFFCLYEIRDCLFLLHSNEFIEPWIFSFIILKYKKNQPIYHYCWNKYLLYQTCSIYWMKLFTYFICVMMNHKISVKVAKVLCGLNQTRRTGQKTIPLRQSVT